MTQDGDDVKDQESAPDNKDTKNRKAARRKPQGKTFGQRGQEKAK